MFKKVHKVKKAPKPPMEGWFQCSEPGCRFEARTTRQVAEHYKVKHLPDLRREVGDINFQWCRNQTDAKVLGIVSSAAHYDLEAWEGPGWYGSRLYVDRVYEPVTVIDIFPLSHVREHWACKIEKLKKNLAGLDALETYDV